MTRLRSRSPISLLLYVSTIVAMLALAAPLDAAKPYSLLLKGGRIVDGTGAPWYRGDIAIRGSKIARIGRIDETQAETVVDVSGLVVAPGFIDMMGQTATPMLRDPATGLNLLTQGITTINAGEGASAAPLTGNAARTEGWGTMAEYFQLLELKGLPVNVVQTVGHTQIRRQVLGDVDRRPTPEELKQMQALVREAMQAGAIGVSTALIYPPAVYATTEEIAALCKVAGESGGRYYTHMRNEGDQLLDAIDEALEIGRTAGTPVHIFHLKAAGRQNWGQMDLAIARIKAARAAGQQVAADIYPYVNNGLGIAAFVHPKHFTAGQGSLRNRLDDADLRKQIRTEMETDAGYENWYRHTGNDWSKVVVGSTTSPKHAKFGGRSVAEIAGELKEDAWDTFFELVRHGAFVMPETMTEANKNKLIQQEFISFCTDVGPAGGSRIASHPRGYGAFPRLLARYVRDRGVVSLPRVIAQASALAANEVMAYDRGRISVGLAADIIAFDEKRLIDRADFGKPDALSEGMQYVVVNGQVVLEKGKYTKKRPGRVLRGPGYQPEKSSSAVTTGDAVPELAAFDRMMQRFVEEHHIPGAALAVTAGSRLVLARGYGYADVAAKQPATPQSLFRIASISKPITAVAILKLVEAGKLSLDDPVFEHLKHEPHLEEGTKFDERQKKITIRHCLQHRGGWDRAKSFDAMFQSVKFADRLGVLPPAGPDAVIRCMLGERLDFDPGERYAYSNYGYCLLGRVVEKLTDQTYEQYVQQQVLKPIGIESMRIGATHLKGRHLPHEVRYYDPAQVPSVFAADRDAPVPAPYGSLHLEAMDSHGAWIASAVDLARFACAFDDPAACPLLKPESVRTLYGRPPGLAGHDEEGEPKATYYSLGWMNRLREDGTLNNWHTGSLAGTATFLLRRHDGLNFAVLFNARRDASVSHFGRAIDPLLHEVANSIATWPGHDFFGER
ncbi:MAG: D-aminoacylase [Planctomycetaceae bacterium]|nr:D-aminoacylase [Planctomycetaceae bacterium]